MLSGLPRSVDRQCRANPRSGLEISEKLSLKRWKSNGPKAKAKSLRPHLGLMFLRPAESLVVLSIRWRWQAIPSHIILILIRMSHDFE
jgi:hypothetical protein